jgi:tetratricopeptide (TPR) repeat protein
VPENPRIVELRKRVEADPHSIAFAQLAEEYRRSGNFDAAVHCCRAGLQRHPGYLSARVTLGRALIEMESLEEAERELEVVLRTAPDNLAAIRGLAEIHQRRGSLPRALEYYRQALNLARHDPDLEETVHQIDRELGNVRQPGRHNDGFFAQLESELQARRGAGSPADVSLPDSDGPPAPPVDEPAVKSLDLGFDFDTLLASLGQANAPAPPVIESLLSESPAAPSTPKSDVPSPPPTATREPATKLAPDDQRVLHDLETWLDSLVTQRDRHAGD